MFEIGPTAREQFTRLGRVWKQGEHILISGGTGSGKTTLTRHVIEQRIIRRGFVIVFVGKILPDPTILSDYAGFTRWHRFKRNPSWFENKILLWPNTDRYKTLDDKKKLQRDVFNDAFNRLANVGKWTVSIDEGLYTTSPAFLNMGDQLAMMYNVGRSADLSFITLVQRPAHIPLVIYNNVAHAFVGRTRELADQRRLAELGGRESSKELMVKLSGNERRDFTWLPIAPDWPAETLNLSR